MRSKASALIIGTAVLVTIFSGPQAASASESKTARAEVLTYDITVWTGDLSEAGTDAHVWIKIFGTKASPGNFELDSDRNDFERGKADTYLRALPDLGRIRHICLRRDDAGLFPNWYVEHASVGARNTSVSYAASFQRWMPENVWVCQPATLLG